MSQVGDLKACPNPWCEAQERDGDFSPAIRLHHYGSYRVVCTSCVLEGPQCATQSEAAEAWNRRAPTDLEKELGEALEAAESAFKMIASVGVSGEASIGEAIVIVGAREKIAKALAKYQSHTGGE